MEIRRTYGLACNLFVAPKTNTHSLVIGGMAEDTSRWTRVVSRRAAVLLWYALTQHLFPEKAVRVTALVQTMPARAVELPTITHHLQAERLTNGMFEIAGRVSGQLWTMRLTVSEAQRLWDALDVALNPKGWQNPLIAAAEND
jgi:hypothetical protein